MATISRPEAGDPGLRRRFHVNPLEREGTLGYLLLLPTIVVLAIFLLFPFIYGAILSTTTTEVGDETLGQFVGMANYVFEVTKDRIFFGTPWNVGQWGAFFNTFVYTGVTTVFKFGLGLAMALLLNQVFPAQRFVRAALLLPWIIPSVLSTLAWRWMFDPTFSVINWVMNSGLHLWFCHGSTTCVNWLGTPTTAMISLIIVNTWRGTPFYGISFLAGLQTIPVELYEAARVDGASRWEQFRRITMPMLRPVLLVVLLLSTILTFADFQLPWVLTRGAPFNSSHLLATWAYTVAIQGNELGLGATISLYLFPVLTIVIGAVLVTLRRAE
jgi:multiple sugar transport system permease protein